MHDGSSAPGAHAVPGAAPRSRTLVDLPCLHDADGLVAQLLATRSWGPGPEATWLHQRYAELVPRLIPSILVCLRTGESLPPAAFEVVAASAVAQRGSTVPYATVLRGGVPALGCFARFVHDSTPRPTAHQTAVLLGRAAVLAQELGAHWVENWRGVQPVASVSGAGALETGPEVEALPGTLASPALEMVRMVAEGRSNEQIAARTAYSPQAVKWHLARLMREWGVGNRAALVAGAFSRGVLRVRVSD